MILRDYIYVQFMYSLLTRWSYMATIFMYSACIYYFYKGNWFGMLSVHIIDRTFYNTILVAIDFSGSANIFKFWSFRDLKRSQRRNIYVWHWQWQRSRRYQENHRKRVSCISREGKKLISGWWHIFFAFSLSELCDHVSDFSY